MPLLYIDTNVFLDFYQAGTDRLIVFQELLKRADNVVITEQTVQEFKRNRVATLNWLIKRVEETAKLSPFTTTVVKELPGFKNFDQLKTAYQDQSKVVIRELRQWSQEENSDKVFIEFNNLTENCTVFPTTSQNVSRAQTRKLLGNPPASPDKHTIGDELIWETLLEGCKDDLIIVSRDKAFLNNYSILKAEFEKDGSRKLLLVTENLSTALQKLHIPSPEIENAERAIQATRPDQSYSETLICPKCKGELEEFGYEGSDGDEAWWLECRSCRNLIFPNEG